MIRGDGWSRTTFLPNFVMQLSVIGCPVFLMSHTLQTISRYRAPCIPAVPQTPVFPGCHPRFFGCAEYFSYLYSRLTFNILKTLLMKYIIRIAIVDWSEPNEIEKYRRDLMSFCRIAQIRKPVLQMSATGDSFAIDLSGLCEHTQLLWLHLLCDLAALNAHYSTELVALPDSWPLNKLPEG